MRNRWDDADAAAAVERWGNPWGEAVALRVYTSRLIGADAALVNVIVTYRLSVGNVRASLFGIVGGIAQVALLWFFHDSLAQVVLVQVYLMAGLFLCLLVWEIGMHRRHRA